MIITGEAGSQPLEFEITKANISPLDLAMCTGQGFIIEGVAWSHTLEGDIGAITIRLKPRRSVLVEVTAANPLLRKNEWN